MGSPLPQNHKAMTTNPPFPHLLLLVLLHIAAVASTNTAAAQQFKEAPKFYNSPSCPTIDHDSICSSQAVHIAMTLDFAYLRGSMAAILSCFQHSSCPENLHFHFVATSASSHLRETISSSFPYLNFEIYPFDSSSVSGLISTSIRSALDCTLNFARNYLPNILPLCIQKIVYLDSDIILVDDIANLASTSLDGNSVIAAPEYCNADLSVYFTPTFWSNPTLSLTFEGRIRKPCYFNTGVMVIDLDRWRKGDYTRRIIEWMELQKRMRIYELGSLPPFLLVFAGNIVPIDPRWNQHGLGGDNFQGLCRDLHPGPVSLLHWSGKGKPWERIDRNRPCPVDALWAPYDLLQLPASLQNLL